MPEMPEVETIVIELQEAHLEGLCIIHTEVFWPGTIATPESALFCKRLVGQKIVSVTRRGKYILLTLSKDTLLVHLRMTGKFLLDKDSDPLSSHERAQLHFEDGRILHFLDQRKFGKWYLLDDPQTILEKLGIEPLSPEYTWESFHSLLNKSSQQTKPFLLNQHYVVGLGNIYVDEALWEAKIHPEQRANSLTLSEQKALFHAIPLVLKRGIDEKGTALGDHQGNYFSLSGPKERAHLKVFRRQGNPCPRCKAEIIRIKVAQRSTHLCPHCQILKS